MMRLRLFPPAVVVLCLTVLNAHAMAGSIVSVEHDRTYGTQEVNGMAARLFNGHATPPADHSVAVYRLRFRSIDLDGRDTVITAQIFIPRFTEHSERPLYVFAAGTTGLTDSCRTSREHEVGVNWGLYRNHLLAHAGQGIIGVLPDYMHFGDPNRLQPYFVSEAEGRALLDSVRAVGAYFNGPGSSHAVRPARPAFLAGFSQGGHAAFAAADIRDEYAPEVELGGIIGYGPTTNVEDLFREFSLVAPAIIYTYAARYGEDRFDPAAMLADRWLASLEHDVTRLCILGYQSYYPWRPSPLFRPEFTAALVNRRLQAEYPEIHRILSKHNTGLSGHGVPALIMQGTNDVVINQADQTRFVTALRDRGSTVRYRVYPDTPHDTRQAGFREALSWMERQIRNTQESRR